MAKTIGVGATLEIDGALIGVLKEWGMTNSDPNLRIQYNIPPRQLMSQENQTEPGTVEITKDDILSGQCCFAVCNPEGRRFIYRTQCEDDKKDPGKKVIFVRFDDGGVVTRRGKVQRNFEFLGLMHPESPYIHHSVRSSKCGKEDQAFKVAAWATAVIWSNEAIPAGYSILPASEEPDQAT